MLDYEKLYRILFNGITDALDSIEKGEYASAKATLIRAQQAAEDYYIEGNEASDDVMDDEDYTPLYVVPHDVFSGR